MTVRIGITGAAGRMGRMLAEAIRGSGTNCSLTVAIERSGSSLLGADMGELLGGDASGVTLTSDLAAVADQLDVLIDFTVPEATLAQAAVCASRGLPMVTGTTGFTDEQAEKLVAATDSIPLPVFKFCTRRQSDFSSRRGCSQGVGRYRRHRNRGSAPPRKDRCPLRHCAQLG